MILAHGLCSSGLFCLVNIVYERIHRRRLYLNKGLLNIIPRQFILYIYFLILNTGFIIQACIQFIKGFFGRLKFINKNYRIIIEYEVLTLNSSSIIMVILLDWISLLFIRFVLFISSIVIYYRAEYIAEEKNLIRFILLVILFVLSIILLIISPNIISILLGWDGLGLVSYCLVIYYQNIKSYNAGILTALSNRIEIIKGDSIIEIISYLIVLAAITKSAQIPFSSWLPAAMAAPTPVSSL
ncbi:unnamed protein product, partial [Callosobruchus maculatus]